jgi:hypothetical protein
MKKVLLISSVLLLSPLAFGAEHGRTAANKHTNSAAASTDRDKGKDRAADSGKGKKKGLKKLAFWQKKPKS